MREAFQAVGTVVSAKSVKKVPELFRCRASFVGPPEADARCVMTTLAVDDLPMDTDVLRTLARHNRLGIPGAGSFPCAGVYAAVVARGGGIAESG